MMRCNYKYRSKFITKSILGLGFTFIKKTNDTNKIILDAGSGNFIDTLQTYIISSSVDSITLSVLSSTFIKTISNYDSNNFLLGDGSDGDLIVETGTIYLDTGVYNYNNIIISAGASVKTNSDTGILKLKCRGICSIEGEIDTSERDFYNEVERTRYVFLSEEISVGLLSQGGVGGKGDSDSSSVGGNGGAEGYGYGGGGGGGAGYHNFSSTHYEYAIGVGASKGGDGRSNDPVTAQGGAAGQYDATSSYGANAPDVTSGDNWNLGTAGGNGGRRGKHGLTIVIIARDFSGTGTIKSNGEAGQDGGHGGNGIDIDADLYAVGGGGGGGGGGSGGGIMLIGMNSIFGGTIESNGGAGGLGGAKGTTVVLGGTGGTDGEDGTAGGDGTIVNKLLNDMI